MSDPERAKAVEQLLLSEPAAARVTGELIAEILEDFGLPRAREFSWFAEKIRTIAFVDSRQRMPMGNAEKRDNLLALAKRLRDTWEDVRALNHHVFDDKLSLIRQLEIEDQPYARWLLKAAYSDETLVWLAKFFEELAARMDQKKQPPKWRAATKRKWRVQVALLLMPVFEEGFSRKATLDKWPSTAGAKGLGPWAEFYERVMTTAIGEKATPDLEGVLSEARKQLGISGYSPGHFIVE